MAQNFIYNDQKVSVGDNVSIHQEITEGGKKRVQVFEGLVIAIKNRGVGQSFTVRKIATGGIGVEKIFPVALPGIEKIVVKRTGKVRRNKLYYLRERTGKRAIKVKEKKTYTKTAAAE